MLSYALLAALSFAASTTQAAPQLLLHLSGSTNVQHVDNLKISATVTNTGDQTLKLLNDPRGVLSTDPTNTFTISRSDVDVDRSPAFTGMMVKYVPSQVVKANNSASFTILAPGEFVTVEHDLSSAYNFTSSAEGLYTINASDAFYYVDSETQEVVPLRAFRGPTTHTFSLSGRLAVDTKHPPRARLSKRIQFLGGCTAEQQEQVLTAAPLAHQYAVETNGYTLGNTASTPRYKTWFGEYTAARASLVAKHFSNMLLNGSNPEQFHYDCSCTSDSYAFVYPDRFGTIHLCNSFWTAPMTGTDSKAGTIVHESSHFFTIGHTGDYVYKQGPAMELAQTDPDTAIKNADNNEYYAENTPFLA